MKLRILSDLHEEFAPRFGAGSLGELNLPLVQADVTVLAGDIANGEKAILVAARPCFANTQVLVIAGNHEYYGTNMQGAWASMHAAVQVKTNIHLLQRKVWCQGAVRILGVTLWTDYALAGEASREQVMLQATPHMADYRLIDVVPGRKLTAKDTVAMHLQDLAWLEAELAAPWIGKTVVITHHAPHPRSVAMRFANNAINGGFVSNLERVMPGVDLWIHGHTHDGFDYVVQHAHGRSTRVVANPAGYRKRLPEGGFAFENPTFTPDLVVEI
jgi:Calcineurin-like phosphoesterase